jgi:hypothetical protein
MKKEKSEAPGVLIGLSNIMTSRTDRASRGGEPDPERRDLLRTLARRALEGRESFVHDAVLAGRRVRLFSTSHHLCDFFRDNFPTPAEWKTSTGKDVPRDAAFTIWAVIGIEGAPQGSCIAGPEAFLFNTSWYGDLRALAMECLARSLAMEAHVLHAGAVEVGGKGLVWRYPKEIIHPTPTWGLLELPGSRIVADGWVVADADGRVQALEKQLYVRTSLVESYPALLPKILRAKFENVPAQPAPAEAVLEEARRHDSQRVLAGLPPERALEIAGRLIGSKDARMMVDPAALYGRARVATALKADAAFALKAADGAALQVAPVEPFPCPGWTVNVGAVEGHPREIARLLARPA